MRTDTLKILVKISEAVERLKLDKFKLIGLKVDVEHSDGDFDLILMMRQQEDGT